MVDAKENVGFAGVAARAEAAGLLPNSAPPVLGALANRPGAGAAEVAAGGCIWFVLFCPPNRPPVGVDAPLPKAAGLLPVLPALPNRPPEAGAVLPPAPPNIPPLAGIEVVAGVVEAAPPKRPLAGVVEAPPNRPGPGAVGVAEVFVVAESPPKRPPAGFCVEAPVC